MITTESTVCFLLKKNQKMDNLQREKGIYIPWCYLHPPKSSMSQKRLLKFKVKELKNCEISISLSEKKLQKSTPILSSKHRFCLFSLQPKCSFYRIYIVQFFPCKSLMTIYINRLSAHMPISSSNRKNRIFQTKSFHNRIGA